MATQERAPNSVDVIPCQVGHSLTTSTDVEVNAETQLGREEEIVDEKNSPTRKRTNQLLKCEPQNIVDQDSMDIDGTSPKRTKASDSPTSTPDHLESGSKADVSDTTTTNCTTTIQSESGSIDSPQQTTPYNITNIFAKLDGTCLIKKFLSICIDQIETNLELKPGVSFLAYCNNLDYHDKTIPVIIHKDYYPGNGGQFTLNEEVWELKCPECKQAIQGDYPQGIGFRNCDAQIKYRVVNGESGSFAVMADCNTFAFSQLRQIGKAKFNYVKIKVNMHMVTSV